MTAPRVGQLTPKDLTVGQVVHLTGIGNNRRAEPTTAEVVKIGRSLVTAAITRDRHTFDVVLRLDSQAENGDFPGWRFRTVDQAEDDRRRSAARERLRALGVEFVANHSRGPAADHLVDVDLAEVLAAAADAWKAVDQGTMPAEVLRMATDHLEGGVAAFAPDVDE